jgi:hypothetical protein
MDDEWNALLKMALVRTGAKRLFELSKLLARVVSSHSALLNLKLWSEQERSDF